jgi:signal transduction histidine kinase
MRRLTLSQRFALSIFSVGLFLVIPLVSLQTHQARRALEQRVQTSSVVIVDAIESLARAHLKADDIPLLRRELADLVHHNRLAYIDLFGANGTPLISLSNPQHPRGFSRESEAGKVQDNVLDLMQPLGDPRKPDGRIDVGIWVEGVKQDTNRIAREGLWMGLGLCVCLALISFGLGRWLAGRLRRLSNEIATRNPDDFRHLEFRGSDEVSALFKAFNDLQDRLKDTQERRDRAERERQDMTHMLVHDLKGPLGAFSAGLGLLEDAVNTSHDASQVQLVQLMERSTARLLRMTNAILQLNRLEDDTVHLAREPIQLERLLAQRTDEARLSARDLGIELRMEPIPPALPSAVGDSDAVGRVVDNLIFNALEHTPHGGRVIVSAHPAGPEVRISIHDTGPGVPPEEREVIFEKFRKGGEGSRGVGLGLAYCKQAVERLGGRISVDGATEGGAVFYFTLPAAPRSQPPEEPSDKSVLAEAGYP